MNVQMFFLEIYKNNTFHFSFNAIFQGTEEIFLGVYNGKGGGGGEMGDLYFPLDNL